MPHPDEVPLGRRAVLVLAVVVVNTAVYLAINAHPVRTPQPLALTWLDAAVGWHAWAIWPYWLLLLVAPALALGIRSRQRLWATLRAHVIALSTNAVIWLAWPTTLPRAPLPIDLDTATSAAWRLLYALDAATNCFPSGHVTLPVVAAIGFCGERPSAAGWVWPALVVLTPSVIATGQHYAWDIAGGAATALFGWWVSRRMAARTPAADPVRDPAPHGR